MVHLSDIHFSNTEKSLQLLDSLKNDLKAMKSEVGRFDSIIITGDCIDKGKTEYFSLLAEKLKTISKECNVKKNRVFSVPGNHDASRNNEWLSSVIDSKKDDIALQLQTVQQEMSPLFPAYNKFIEQFSNVRDGIGVKDIKIGDIHVRIIMLNSSWSTLINNKYGDLRLGDAQLLKIRTAIKASKVKKPEITVACLHHPLDWFAYDDRMKLQKLLYEDCDVDILLHGHIHEADFAATSNVDLATRTFCTGISYIKSGEKSSRKDGMRYSIYEVNITTKTINVYLRATNSRGKFIADNTLYSKVAKDGFFVMPFGNPFDCIIPIKSINREGKSNVFLDKTFADLMLEKEELLFNFYCGVTNFLESLDLNKEKEKYRTDWDKQYDKTLPDKEKEEKFEKDFYQYIFEFYCMYIVNVLNALFFQKDKQVRYLIRIYDQTLNQHVAKIAERFCSTIDDLKTTKNFKWGEGMIYQSYLSSSALLKSANPDLHINGNSTRWLDYLTITFSKIRIKTPTGDIPLLSFNIAISNKKSEKCLYALAHSSLYDKLQELFLLFDQKVYPLAKLYSIA